MRRKEGITAHDLELLQLSANGKKNAEISKQIFISVKTVEITLKNICVKLGARNMKQAINEAWKRGLFKREGE